MTRYQRKAKRALARFLANVKEPVSLFSVSCRADEFARAAGKVRDLYDSLWDYEYLLPSGWSVKMLTTGGDSLAYACPPGWTPGSTPSRSLLLGGGNLVEANYRNM